MEGRNGCVETSIFSKFRNMLIFVHDFHNILYSYYNYIAI